MRLEELQEGKILDKLKKMFGFLKDKREERYTTDNEDFDFATDGEYETAAKMLKTVSDRPMGGIGIEKSTGVIHVMDLDGKEFLVKDGDIKYVGREFDEDK